MAVRAPDARVADVAVRVADATVVRAPDAMDVVTIVAVAIADEVAMPIRVPMPASRAVSMTVR
jgi:hypothetical protein